MDALAKLFWRQLVFLVVVGGLCNSNAAQAGACPNSDYDLTTQAEVNAFPQNCDHVTGSLKVRGAQITNLAPLEDVQTVGADLYIKNNDSLATLDGLSGVTSVGAQLYISYNDLLTDISALANLTTVGSDLYIRDNDSLATLDGLSGVTSVGAQLYISYNPSLTDISALSNLVSIVNGLWIAYNQGLSNCSALAVVLGAKKCAPQGGFISGSLDGNVYLNSNDSNGACNTTSEILSSYQAPSSCPVSNAVLWFVLQGSNNSDETSE